MRLSLTRLARKKQEHNTETTIKDGAAASQLEEPDSTLRNTQNQFFQRIASNKPKTGPVYLTESEPFVSVTEAKEAHILKVHIVHSAFADDLRKLRSERSVVSCLTSMCLLSAQMKWRGMDPFRELGLLMFTR